MNWASILIWRASLMNSAQGLYGPTKITASGLPLRISKSADFTATVERIWGELKDEVLAAETDALRQRSGLA